MSRELRRRAMIESGIRAGRCSNPWPPSNSVSCKPWCSPSEPSNIDATAAVAYLLIFSPELF